MKQRKKKTIKVYEEDWKYFMEIKSETGLSHADIVELINNKSRSESLINLITK